jgi:hypothetical protein
MPLPAHISLPLTGHLIVLSNDAVVCAIVLPLS